MSHFCRLRNSSILKWGFSNSVHSHRTQLGLMEPLFLYMNNPRYYRTKKLPEKLNDFGQNIAQLASAVTNEAQAALLDYLHSTRSLRFMDAEYISKNSPRFLEKILQKIDIESDIARSITRFLRYHPINEFEPFFESLGLEPSEYSSILPRDLMFLNDDELLMENYSLLCDYGVPRSMMGKICKEAGEVLKYDYGILKLKLRAYEELGYSQPFMAKAIVSSPYLLVGDVNVDFLKVMSMLSRAGIGLHWIEKKLLERSSCKWRWLLAVLQFFSRTGYSDEKLGLLIRKHPEIFLEDSGIRTLLLVGFLCKFGSPMSELSSMFLQFPQMQVAKFASNLRQCYLFLNEIEMETREVGKVVRGHPLLLGSCKLKKTNSLLSSLNTGRKRVCKLIQDDPQIMKKWVLGMRNEPLPVPEEEIISRQLKAKFLLDLGFMENSKEMEKALKVFRGKGADLQERFDCIVEAGLDKEIVVQMVKVSPQILNQKKDVLKTKIDTLVNDLGYPIKTLTSFPSYLSYTTQRVKLRLAMFNWLKDEGTADPKLRLTTIVACSEDYFLRQHVRRHPKGPVVWEEMKGRYVE